MNNIDDGYSMAAGVTHCDCLERARKKVESMMPNAGAEGRQTAEKEVGHVE